MTPILCTDCRAPLGVAHMTEVISPPAFPKRAKAPEPYEQPLCFPCWERRQEAGQ